MELELELEISLPAGATGVTRLPLRVGATLTVGRSEEADVRLDDPEMMVSRRHLDLVVFTDHVDVVVIGRNGARRGEDAFGAGAKLTLKPGESLIVLHWTLTLRRRYISWASDEAPCSDWWGDDPFKGNADTARPDQPSGAAESETINPEEFRDLLERDFSGKAPLQKTPLAAVAEGQRAVPGAAVTAAGAPEDLGRDCDTCPRSRPRRWGELSHLKPPARTSGPCQ